MMRSFTLICLFSLAMAGCNSKTAAPDEPKAAAPLTAEPVEITEIDINDLPSGLMDVIKTERADFTPTEVLKKEREGRVYYDVEGNLPSGEEIEFDILMQDGVPQIVEVQRDVEFSQLAQEVQDILLRASANTQPVRVIESVQNDGAVVYEFFMPNQGKEPSYEVRVYGGKAELLNERSQH